METQSTLRSVKSHSSTRLVDLILGIASILHPNISQHPEHFVSWQEAGMLDFSLSVLLAGPALAGG